MMQGHMSRDDIDIVERDKADLRQLEEEIAIAEKDLEILKAKRAALMKEIDEHSDEKYEQSLLTMVYEQRNKKKK